MQDAQREIEGIQMVLAGLTQGCAWMPTGCASERSLKPLEGYLRDRVILLEGRGRPERQPR